MRDCEYELCNLWEFFRLDPKNRDLSLESQLSLFIRYAYTQLLPHNGSYWEHLELTYAGIRSIIECHELQKSVGGFGSKKSVIEAL